MRVSCGELQWLASDDATRGSRRRRISLAPPMNGRYIDAEDLGRARLVASALCNHPGDVLGFQLSTRNQPLRRLLKRRRGGYHRRRVRLQLRPHGDLAGGYGLTLVRD